MLLKLAIKRSLFAPGARLAVRVILTVLGRVMLMKTTLTFLPPELSETFAEMFIISPQDMFTLFGDALVTFGGVTSLTTKVELTDALRLLTVSLASTT